MADSPWIIKGPDGKVQATLFRLRNRYNDEYIACNDNRSVFRWGYDEGDDHQRWLIVPAPGQNGRMNIYTKTLEGSRVMAVVRGSAGTTDGQMEMWEPNNGDGELYTEVTSRLTSLAMYCPVSKTGLPV
jgi:hypothetical protein